MRTEQSSIASDPITFRFRSIDTTGTIRLLNEMVETTAQRSGTRWSYETPYSTLRPHPISKWTTSSSLWVVLVVGALGVCGAISSFIEDVAHIPQWAAVLVFIASIFLLWYGYIHRREEWITFPADIDSLDVCFCRNGPDADSFTEFTGILLDRIRSHTPSSEQRFIWRVSST